MVDLLILIFLTKTSLNFLVDPLSSVSLSTIYNSQSFYLVPSSPTPLARRNLLHALMDNIFEILQSGVVNLDSVFFSVEKLNESLVTNDLIEIESFINTIMEMFKFCYNFLRNTAQWLVNF